MAEKDADVLCPVIISIVVNMARSALKTLLSIYEQPVWLQVDCSELPS
jgi:hypothetical protein